MSAAFSAALAVPGRKLVREGSVSEYMKGHRVLPIKIPVGNLTLLTIFSPLILFLKDRQQAHAHTGTHSAAEQTQLLQRNKPKSESTSLIGFPRWGVLYSIFSYPKTIMNSYS